MRAGGHRVGRAGGVAGALAVLSLASATLSACGSGSGPAPSVATLLGAGSAASRQGDYNGATQLFQQAIKKDPNNATAHYDVGAVYQAQGLDRQALGEYAQALRQNPNLVSAIFNQATIYGTHDAPLAMFLYRKVIALQPNSPTAYLNLGLLEAQEGLRSQAGADLRKAIQLNPSLRSNIPPSAQDDLSAPPPQTAHPPAATTSVP